MKQLFEKGFWRKAIRLWRQILALNIPLYAANAGFFIVLSLFPALVLLLRLLRQAGLDAFAFMDLVSPLLPEALVPTLEPVILNAYQHSSGMVIGLSAVTALWSTGRGIYSLRAGLNRMYRVREDKGYVSTRILSTAYTFACLLMVVVTVLFQVFGSDLLQLLISRKSPLLGLLMPLFRLRVILLLGLQTLFFALIYRFLPGVSLPFSGNLPGALVTAVSWSGFSQLFSLYVRYFPMYANIYGSVYALALGMLWLYCCLSILFFGGAMNYALWKKKQHKSNL